jgi:8-oxo-dGTP pyrophosphatase MutT (NUDIX family)
MSQPRAGSRNGAVAAPRLAATVAVVRDGDQGLQTWVLHRVQEMAFAPGATVFPGGGVDADDADLATPWSEPILAERAARMLVEPPVAFAVITAAFRELFEETGLLLTRPVTPHAGHAGLEDDRRALESRQLRFRDLLVRRGLALDVTAFLPWARWVTPPSQPRRYDTWTFVAAVPPSGRARPVTSEAVHAEWVNVDDVVRGYETEQIHVLPPTAFVLRSLGAAGSVGAVLDAAAHRRLEVIHPQASRRTDGTVVVHAGGEDLHVVGSARAAAQPGGASGRPS